MFKYTKKGRRSQAVRDMISDIDNRISGMRPEDVQRLNGVTASSPKELEDFLNKLKAGNPFPETEPPKVEEKQAEKMEKGGPIEKKEMAEKTVVEDAQVIEESNQPITQAPLQKGGIPDSFGSGYNPLAQDLKEREYSTPKIDYNAGVIPEPEIDVLGVSQNSEEEYAQVKGGEGGPSEASTPPSEDKGSIDNVSNPSMSELSGKEKEVATEQLVDTALDAYEMLHEVAKNNTKYDDRKVQKMRLEGVISDDMAIPVSESQQMTPYEFLQEHNESIDEILTFPQESRDAVKPAMMREFGKKGWGLTDGQYLMMWFGKDVAMKASMVMGMRNQTKQILQSFQEMHEEKITAMSNHEPAVTPDSITKPSQEGYSESGGKKIDEDENEVEETKETESTVEE